MTDIHTWLAEHDIESVECVVADMAGVARGKLQHVAEFGDKSIKLPVALFGQTVNGTFYMRDDNVQDRDMECRPDLTTLRLQPWAKSRSACVLLDCYIDDRPVEACPRSVLQRVISRYHEHGWHPVVAPEVEFYLGTADSKPHSRGAGSLSIPDPYGMDQLHELHAFFAALQSHCSAQDIDVGAVSQELGLGQFEVNFNHGDPLRLADDVFHFKRTLKQTALAHGLEASFLAKLSVEKPGSSLHLHQSVCDQKGANVFSAPDGSATALFEGFVAGLQTHLREALLLLAPYANSYRRFLSHWSSPINLEWGVDNRTVGLRVPECPPAARRVENRVAGSDVNPYLAIAASLACGYLGMTQGAKPRPPVTGSAYRVPFALHRNFYESLDALRASTALADLLGDDFVQIYTATKEQEYRQFQARVPEWERRELTLSV